MSNQTAVSNQIEKLELGQQLEALLLDEKGKTLQREVLKVVQVPGPGDPANAYRLETVEGGWAEIPEAAAPPEAAGEGPFDVLKFAWQIIKDGKPVNHTDGASSFVLYRGSDPMDYGHSREGHSGEYALIVRDNTFKDFVIIEVKFFLEGAYGATPNPAKKEIPNGQYLPSIYFGIPTCHVNGPFIELEGGASMGHPYNVGPVDNVQPRVKVYAKFTMTLFWKSHTWSWGFEADGKDGFKGTGPV